jgi:hypothetical protein
MLRCFLKSLIISSHFRLISSLILVKNLDPTLFAGWAETRFAALCSICCRFHHIWRQITEIPSATYLHGAKAAIQFPAQSAKSVGSRFFTKIKLEIYLKCEEIIKDFKKQRSVLKDILKFSQVRDFQDYPNLHHYG